MNVTEYLLASDAGTRPALLTVARDYTHAELRDGVLCLSSALVAMGGEKQDRVLLIAENSFFWVVAYLATMHAGRVCVPLPPSLSATDLRHVIQTSEPRFAFIQSKYARKAHAECGGRQIVTENDLVHIAGGESGAMCGDDDLAALMFTSGSTGKPRGVMVTHHNIIANTESIVAYLRLSANDRVMAVLPFHYCFGTSLLHSHLRVGGSLVLERRFLFPDYVLKRMQEVHCTGFAGVPTHYQILLRQSSLKHFSFPCLRYVQQAGGHLAPIFVHELRQALPGVDVFIMYGQTEATARLAYLAPEMLDKKLGSIGKAILGVQLEIVDSVGNRCPPGQIGEIVARGDNVTAGYWHDPHATAVCFRGGWLHTGDLATADNEGFLYLVDRAKDVLKCGGNRVSSREVEDRLLEFEGVREAAVVGIPDDVLGEAVKAFVVPSSNDSSGLDRELQGFCKRRFPPHLVPRDIVIIDSLPKNNAGKVVKAALRNHVQHAADTAT